MVKARDYDDFSRFKNMVKKNAFLKKNEKRKNQKTKKRKNFKFSSNLSPIPHHSFSTPLPFYFPLNTELSIPKHMSLGGFTSFSAPTEEQLTLFASFKAQIVAEVNAGVNAEETALGVPTGVATQLVNGTNFKFQVKIGDKDYLVVIYQKGPWDGGAASLTSVTAA
jgi:hypothetical protein